MRLVVISDTHGLHNRIEDLPDGDVLVHAGDFMNSGYDPRDVLSFNRWLGEQPFKLFLHLESSDELEKKVYSRYVFIIPLSRQGAQRFAVRPNGGLDWGTKFAKSATLRTRCWRRDIPRFR